MSDNTVEITETSDYTITIDTSLVQNDNNIVIDLSSPNNIDVINNNTTILVGDLPQGYPIDWTVGDLPISRVSGLDIIGGSGISVISDSGIYTVSLSDPTIYSSDIIDFDTAVSGLLPSFSGISGVAITNINNTYTIGLSDPTIELNNISDLSLDARTFLLTPSSTNLQNLITNETGSGLVVFNNSPSFSGTPLTPTATSGISNNQIASTQFVSNEIMHRVSTLLAEGNYIDFNYNSINNILTISSTGLQPSGNYSIVGHTHSSSDITNFSSAVSGLIPSPNFTSLSGISGIVVTNSGTNYFVSLSDPTIQLNDITDLSSDARTFLLIPSSNNLQSLVSDETGSGLLVFNTSPSFSGTPTVPTAASGTNNTQIANTAFVRNEIANLIDSAPTTLDTLNELAAALGDDPNFATTIASGLASKAPLVHNHVVNDITDFSIGVSGLLPITNITGSSGITVSNSGTTYNVSSSGLAFLSGADFNSLSVTGVPVSVSGHLHDYTDIINWASGIENEVSTLLVAGNYINIDYDNIGDTLTISATGLQPSGSYANSVHSHGNISSSGSIDSISGLLVITGSGGILTTSSGINSSYITDFNSSVSGLLPSVSGSGYVNSNFNNNIYTISVSGLQPSGNYSVVGHTHLSTDITDFNSSVSGLLPVKNIVAGTGIGISSTSGIYTINSTGSGVLADQAKSIVTTVFNKTGSPIPKMTAVYLSGGQGDRPTIALAIGSGDPTSAGTYGLVYETIPNMEEGKVIVFGALTGLDTDQFNPTAPHGDVNGTVLYLSPTTPGSLTTTKPSAPYHMVVIGTIVRTHQNAGVIEVRIQNGYELEELHNVAISGATSGQFLQYNGSGLWIPSSSGNFTTLQLNGTGVSVSGHTHSSSEITDFNTSVSGLLPVTDLLAGSGIVITPSGSVFTINSTGGGGSVNDIIAGSGIVVSSSGGDFTISALQNIINSSNLYLWANFR